MARKHRKKKRRNHQYGRKKAGAPWMSDQRRAEIKASKQRAQETEAKNYQLELDRMRKRETNSTSNKVLMLEKLFKKAEAYVYDNIHLRKSMYKLERNPGLFLDKYQPCEAWRKFEKAICRTEGKKMKTMKTKKWFDECADCPEGHFAWHGTDLDAIGPICYEGLDPRRRSGQAYGPGEYFGKSPATSEGYCKKLTNPNAVVSKMLLFYILKASEEAQSHAHKSNEYCYVINNPINRTFTYCLPLLVIRFIPGYQGNNLTPEMIERHLSTSQTVWKLGSCKESIPICKRHLPSILQVDSIDEEKEESKTPLYDNVGNNHGVRKNYSTSSSPKKNLFKIVDSIWKAAHVTNVLFVCCLLFLICSLLGLFVDTTALDTLVTDSTPLPTCPADNVYFIATANSSIASWTPVTVAPPSPLLPPIDLPMPSISPKILYSDFDHLSSSSLFSTSSSSSSPSSSSSSSAMCLSENKPASSFIPLPCNSSHLSCPASKGDFVGVKPIASHLGKDNTSAIPLREYHADDDLLLHPTGAIALNINIDNPSLSASKSKLLASSSSKSI